MGRLRPIHVPPMSAFVHKGGIPTDEIIGLGPAANDVSGVKKLEDPLSERLALRLALLFLQVAHPRHKSLYSNTQPFH